MKKRGKEVSNNIMEVFSLRGMDLTAEKVLDLPVIGISVKEKTRVMKMPVEEMDKCGINPGAISKVGGSVLADRIQQFMSPGLYKSIFTLVLTNHDC